MLTNYHSHTQFCDGKATMEEFVVEAIKQGFKHWGISPHSPLPMLEQAPWAIKMEQVQEYLEEANRLKTKYKDQIKIFIGMEIDYLDKDYNPSVDYFQNLPLDFRIGSVHLLKSPRTGELVDVDCSLDQFEKNLKFHFNGSTQKIVNAYYDAMTNLVNSGGFTFIGHSDKISANTSELSKRIQDKSWYEALVERFLQLCASKQVVMEINTKAYDVRGVFFPNERHFNRMEELGIKVVINSDAHRLEKISTGLQIAHSLYKGAIVTL